MDFVKLDEIKAEIENLNLNELSYQDVIKLTNKICGYEEIMVHLQRNH